MKVGDYVRTKNGIITKIIGNRKNPYGEETIFELDKEISIYDLELSNMYLMTNPLVEDTTNEIDTHFGDEKIIKISSPNIIDLIEVGDYVNGCEVRDISYYGVPNSKTLLELDKWLGNCYKKIANEDIKSIVTKECFESMEYKVGE